MVESADKDDESGTRADNERIGKHTQSLNESLLHRVAHGCRSRHIGRTAFARLVGKESAFHTIHNSSSQPAACNLLKAKRIGHDDLQHMWNQVVVHDDNDKRQDEVAYRHEGNQKSTDVGDSLYAAEDNVQCCQGQEDTHPYGRPSGGFLHGTANGVGLDGVVGQTELTSDKYGKQNGHPSQVQATQDVVCRSADERVFMFLLVRTGQCGYDAKGDNCQKGQQ